MNTLVHSHSDLIGQLKSFGPLGPVYQIINFSNKKGVLHLKVIESGEELEYPIENAIKDPEA